MDAENRADGEDGKPDMPGESSSAPAQGEGTPSSPGQAILLGTGEPVPEVRAEGTEPPQQPEHSEPAAEEMAPRSLGQGTLATISLEQVAEDTTFQIRSEGEISKLATDVARLGQLFPVDV